MDGDVTTPNLMFPCSNTAQIPSLQILQAWYALYETDQGILVQHVYPLVAWTPWYTKNHNGSRYALSTSTHCNGVPGPGPYEPESYVEIRLFDILWSATSSVLFTRHIMKEDRYPPSPYTSVCLHFMILAHMVHVPLQSRDTPSCTFRWTTQLTDMLGTLFSLLN